MYTIFLHFYRVCKLKSLCWHSFKWNVACISNAKTNKPIASSASVYQNVYIRVDEKRKYRTEHDWAQRRESRRSRENRGKFFDFDYFHFVQPKKPKQITARAIDIKRVRILIQTDIIAESLRWLQFALFFGTRAYIHPACVRDLVC